jgi:hypothetical protein
VCVRRVFSLFAPLVQVGYTSFRARVLLLDSEDHERRGLALKRVSLLTMPWVTENPLFFHLTDTSPLGLRLAADDAAAVRAYTYPTPECKRRGKGKPCVVLRKMRQAHTLKRIWGPDVKLERDGSLNIAAHLFC